MQIETRRGGPIIVKFADEFTIERAGPVNGPARLEVCALFVEPQGLCCRVIDGTLSVDGEAGHYTVNTQELVYLPAAYVAGRVLQCNGPRAPEPPWNAPPRPARIERIESPTRAPAPPEPAQQDLFFKE